VHKAKLKNDANMINKAFRIILYPPLIKIHQTYVMKAKMHITIFLKSYLAPLVVVFIM